MNKNHLNNISKYTYNEKDSETNKDSNRMSNQNKYQS